MQALIPFLILLPLLVQAEPVDQSDWSEKRIASYERFTTTEAPDAVLSIPKLSIRADVYPDTVHQALEGGLSHVSGTAGIGEGGNAAIAGHRDSFFRRLEGIPVDTEIEVTLDDEVMLYKVSEVSIVDALDVSPLDETSEEVLTLITCHPFYYKGYAPDRYIVRAIRVEDPQIDVASSAE